MTSIGRKAEIINIDQAPDRSAVIKHIAEIISAGGIAALPTDTVYGLCCRKGDNKALRRISALKKQPADKPFQTLISSISDAENLCGKITGLAEKFMRSYWPGALTIITEGKSGNPEGLRLPADQDICAVIKKTAVPLSATSVNLHGQEPLSDSADIEKVFEHDIDLIITKNSFLRGKSSTVIRVAGKNFEILREGDLTAEDLVKTAKECFLFYTEQKAVRPLLATIIFFQIHSIDSSNTQIILSVPEISSKSCKLPSAAEKALQEMGYKIILPEIKSASMTDIDTADTIFTFSEKSFKAVVTAAPWRENAVHNINIGDEEFPSSSGKGINIGPGYREDIVKLEKMIWEIHKELQKK